MASDPTVCCVMLTRDRPEMVRQAIRCWASQTYKIQKTRLLIYDSGVPPLRIMAEELGLECRYSDGHTGVLYQRGEPGESIGALRNKANKYASENHYGFKPHDVIIHWDDDDWSHPNRIAEQVALLQSSGADAVGYREVLFWREDPVEVWMYSNPDPRFLMGSSMCYWRSAWENRPFPDRNRGEDKWWRLGVNAAGVTGLPLEFVGSKIPGSKEWLEIPCAEHDVHQQVPRMICRIHSGNAHQEEYQLPTASNSWKRVSEWEDKVRRIIG